MKDIRVVAELVTPRLASAALSPFDRVMHLRDQVHRAALFEVPGVPFTSSAELLDIGQAYRQAVLERSRANLCNGKAVLLMAALRAYGFRSRMVAFYRDVVASPSPAFTHASVDVEIDGRWIAIDPYFNLSFKGDDGQWLGWTEAVAGFRAGRAPRITSMPFVQMKGQTIADYEAIYTTRFEALMRHVVFTPVEGGDIERLNPEWDGILRYADGTTFDAYASARWPMFRSLSSPILDQSAAPATPPAGSKAAN